MTDKQNKKNIIEQFLDIQTRVMEWLMRSKATGGWRSYHLWIITAIFALLAYIFYFVLNAYHDIYIIIFFYPMMYASISYRLKGAVIGGLAFLAIVLPNAIFLSTSTDALLNTLLLVLLAFIINGMGATLLNYLEGQMNAYKEILNLNNRLNASIKQLEQTQKQLIQSEKMSALGGLSASVAHEINNPLAGVLVYAKLMSKKLASGNFDKDEFAVNMKKIEDAVSYCSKIVRSLLDFARQTEPTLKPVNVKDVIEQVITLVGHQAQIKHVKIVRNEADAVPPIMADFGQIQQVFVNLMVNAVQATPEEGQITISTVRAADGMVKIIFADTGVGIAPENMKKLFTPFFTTKGEVKGVGLGLSVSYGLVERHGGKIEVESELGKGSAFTVLLPAAN
ncbi:MAG: ATP-binding protein [Dehalococcoidales bacterium]|nr:ATP-binding protein [Dehalococcoidales bacterium]